MIRVLLIEDQELVRTGFRLILKQQTDIDVVGEAESGEQGITLARSLKPDVILCDLHLPGVSGLEVTERLSRSGSGPAIIIVSVQDDGGLPRRLLDAGARGYLSKGCSESELLRAIRDVSRGKRYLGADIAQRLALDERSGGNPFDTLSKREMEIALLLCQGLRMSEIARRLLLSPKTVSTHKYNLFDKLGIGDAVALVRLAAQHGVVDPSRPLSFGT